MGSVQGHLSRYVHGPCSLNSPPFLATQGFFLSSEFPLLPFTFNSTNTFHFPSNSTYTCAWYLQILPLQQTMKHKKGFTATFGVLNISVVVLLMILWALGFFGYWKYGNMVKDNLVNNLTLDGNAWVIYGYTSGKFETKFRETFGKFDMGFWSEIFEIRKFWSVAGVFQQEGGGQMRLLGAVSFPLINLLSKGANINAKGIELLHAPLPRYIPAKFLEKFKAKFENTAREVWQWIKKNLYQIWAGRWQFEENF